MSLCEKNDSDDEMEFKSNDYRKRDEMPNIESCTLKKTMIMKAMEACLMMKEEIYCS